ncbi:MAG: hypothetical protein J0652_03245 [Desulfobulbaceae bacterium]|nr:hypothetical protein [Desulfobulbaceae bacterium]
MLGYHHPLQRITVIPRAGGVHTPLTFFFLALIVIPAQAGIHNTLNLSSWIPDKSTRE